jgi:hypothetical protein
LAGDKVGDQAANMAMPESEKVFFTRVLGPITGTESGRHGR